MQGPVSQKYNSKMKVTLCCTMVSLSKKWSGNIIIFFKLLLSCSSSIHPIHIINTPTIASSDHLASPGNALARVQRVHEPADLWDITFLHPLILRLLLLSMCTRCFETQSSPGGTCTRRSKILTHSLVWGPYVFGTK